jgi:hypothetical protein
VLKEPERRTDDSPKTIGPCSCAIFMVLGVWLGAGGVFYIALKAYESTRRMDWWLMGLLFLPLIWVCMETYVYVFPLLKLYLRFHHDKWLIIGRFLSYLTFPFFVYLVALLIWFYINKNSIIISASGLIGGGLAARVVQKTLFAREHY